MKKTKQTTGNKYAQSDVPCVLSDVGIGTEGDQARTDGDEELRDHSGAATCVKYSQRDLIG